MKHKTLEILQTNDVLVPSFFVVKSADDYTPVKAFLLSDDKKYAVRSSFGNEDGKDGSYAGQFDTILNVDKDGIRDAIRKVFDSAKKSNVQQYSDAMKINQEADGCVIIQEMIDAEMAGVLFTANPLGILNESVFVVGYGLGDNVVSDKINTASYFYNNDDGVFYREGPDDAPTLDQYLIKKLLRLGEQVKKILGYEADIEFAIRNNHIFVLQARPITTLKFDSPIVLDNSNIVESYPGVSLPLTQDFVKEIYHDIFYNLMVRITKREDVVKSIDCHLKDMVDVANWRIYYRISNWYYVLKMLPFSNRIIPIWQNMLGVQNKKVSMHVSKPIPANVKFNVMKSFLCYMKTAPTHMEALNKKFDSLYPQYKARVEVAEDVEELLDIYYSIKDEILSEWDITLINDMYTFIYTALAGKKHKDGISDFKNLESMKPVNAINELIIYAQSSGVDNPEYDELEEDYIDKFGDRCIGELKLETQTYRTNPEMLRNYVSKAAKTFAVNKNNQPIDAKSSGFFVKKARIGIQNREISRLNRSKLFGITRTIFIKIGSILTNGGKLNHARDVFYLRINEIKKQDGLKAIVEQRKLDEQCFKTIPPYTRLVFSERVVNKENTLIESHVINDTDSLRGIASSTGKVIGEVLVIDEPSLSIDSTDKIIVTKSTDPGWVFLIQHAKGIVAEKGSLLSHTAIISRELHKPAVVNVKDCTRILKTGDIVELDADTGIVKILEKSVTSRKEKKSETK